MAQTVAKERKGPVVEKPCRKTGLEIPMRPHESGFEASLPRQKGHEGFVGKAGGRRRRAWRTLPTVRNALCFCIFRRQLPPVLSTDRTDQSQSACPSARSAPRPASSRRLYPAAPQLVLPAPRTSRAAYSGVDDHAPYDRPPFQGSNAAGPRPYRPSNLSRSPAAYIS